MLERGTSVLGLAVIILALGAVAAMAEGEGDSARGKELFDANCSYCHGIDAGTFKIGPPLGGVYGRKAGSGEYADYVGLKDMEVVWNDETLDKYIADPRKFVGGTVGMPASMKDPQARADLIAYLKTL